MRTMRPREEIEIESSQAADQYPEDQYSQRKLIIELLLDIRDLLVDGKIENRI